MSNMDVKVKEGELLAALDLGSNSFHLIVARMDNGKIDPIERIKKRIKLGAGLDAQQELSNDSIIRAIDWLEKARNKITELSPDKVRVVATHTVRVAKNRNTFLLLAERALGYPIEVISGREEARLVFQGVTRSESLEGTVLVVDIGGGSTELAIGKGDDPEYRDSLSMGCVSYSRRFFSETINKEAFRQAHIVALQQLELCSYQFKRYRCAHVLATSGTAKALCKAVGLVGENTDRLVLSELLMLREFLCQKENFSKLSWAGIDEKRAAVIPGGLAIMIAVMKSLDIESLRYCDSALREGVLFEMEQMSGDNSTRLRTRHGLQTEYQIDRRHAQLVAETCDHLYQQVAEDWELARPELRDLLLESAQLHEIGLQISASNLQRHSGYILAHCDLPGYNQEEQAILSFLVSHFRKPLRLENLPSLRGVKKKTLLSLVRLLRVAVVFNRCREPLLLDLLTVKIKRERMKLTVEKPFLADNEAIIADIVEEAKMMSDIGQELIITVR